MIDVVIGVKDDLQKCNLKIDQTKVKFITAEKFASISSVNQIIICDLKRLSDKDIKVLNNIPFLLLISSSQDFIHLRMHLDEKRLVLTPFDYIHVSKSLKHFVKNFHWIQPFLIEFNNDQELIDLQNCSNIDYALKDDFLKFPKSVWVSLNYKFRELELSPFYPVLAAPKKVQKTLCIFTPISKTIEADYMNLPPDLLVSDFSSVKTYLDKFPMISGLILLCLIDKKNSIEYYYQEISSYIHVPTNLNEVKFIGPDSDGKLLCSLIIEIQR